MMPGVLFSPVEIPVAVIVVADDSGISAVVVAEMSGCCRGGNGGSNSGSNKKAQHRAGIRRNAISYTTSN